MSYDGTTQPTNKDLAVFFVFTDFWAAAKYSNTWDAGRTGVSGAEEVEGPASNCN